MSFPESDISDLLDKADSEELYEKVHDIVNYVDDNSYSHGLQDISDSFNTLDDVQAMELKQELIFSELELSPEALLPQSHIISQPIPRILSVPMSVCNEDYAGPHIFEVSIIPNGSKNPWVYSTILNKVFIDMGAHFPVDFRVSSRPSETLFIRVLPAFSSLQYSQDLVYRCVQHEQPGLNKDVPDHVRQHIIRCKSNPNAQYLGDKKANQRLSIVFPFSYPQTGTDAVREMFFFVCKNSCPTGMNRKPIEIIFTLETYEGQILGRRILNVRICSCPKRDKEKEEKDTQNKDTPSHGKKRKLEGKVEKIEKKAPSVDTLANDNNIHTITVNLAGKNNVQQALKYCQDLMAGEIMKKSTNTDAIACYKKLQAQIDLLNS
ncbi:hypothetical protein WA026_016517 [Henosepilachna vigintioctopunctata]|uniref:p53 DNA-binding domain-containing protein n=1 Tax=Henosepilachna vigintioctopunctata TaxID=420089 RepID=A0AAW1VGG5_9CUCU